MRNGALARCDPRFRGRRGSAEPPARSLGVGSLGLWRRAAARVLRADLAPTALSAEPVKWHQSASLRALMPAPPAPSSRLGGRSSRGSPLVTTLWARRQDKIYTWVGASNTVLISVNPFKTLPLYTPDIIDMHRYELVCERAASPARAVRRAGVGAVA